MKSNSHNYLYPLKLLASMNLTKIDRFLLLVLPVLISLNAVGQTMGLMEYSDTTSIGYTLFAPLSDENTYLIDQCGHLVHQWNHEFVPGQAVYLLDDGRMLRQERVLSEVFSGGGIGGRLAIYDWDGNETWSYTIANDTLHAHHDMAVLPNGNIAVIAWEFHGFSACVEAGRAPESMETSVFTPTIIELEPVGTNQANYVWIWRMWDHLIQDFDSEKANYGVVADHPELMDFNFLGASQPQGADWMHLNALNYNPELDQFMFSSRYTSEVYIIDHSTTTEEAAGHSGGIYGKGGDILYRYGNPEAYDRGDNTDRKFFLQHDCQWVPQGYDWEGQFSVYNNVGGGVGSSTVDYLTPPQDSAGFYTNPGTLAYGPDEFNWSWTEPGLFSSFISGSHTLENGNILVCEGAPGTFKEVTPAGNVIWEYICPIGLNGPMTQGNAPSQNAVFRCTRIPINHPGLEGQDLTPNGPLEFEPLDYECMMATSYPDSVVDPPDTNDINIITPPNLADDASGKDTTTTFLANLSRQNWFDVFPNPVKNHLTIEGDGQAILEIYSSLGQRILAAPFNRKFVIDTSSWNTGLYMLILKKEDQIQIEKILKL